MKPNPTIFRSLLPILALFFCLLFGAIFWGFSDALLITSLLFAAFAAGILAYSQGKNWDDIQKETGVKIAGALPAIIILLAIGILVGSWMFSGTIPLMVYWGIEIVSPRYIVLTAFLATAAMSMASGTSWGSAGTMGVALMATAAALDAPLATTAGAIVSGAYFGDKMSPMSDSTNISAIGAGADLYDHIGNMVYTAFPSFTVALIAYLTLGVFYTGDVAAVPDSARVIQKEISGVFNLGFVAVIPPFIAVTGMIKRYPAALVILTSSVAALIIGVISNGFGFQDALKVVVSGFSVSMAGADANIGEGARSLLDRGGLSSMTGTLLFIISAFLMAAALEVSGALNTLLNALLARIKSTFSLIAATMTAGATLISMTSHGGVTALIVGNLFQDSFKEKELAPENLSRSIEDSVTIVEPLLPWTVSAVFMATTLGVPTVEYAPWAIFCFLGPVFSLVYAATFDRTGFGLKRSRRRQ
ncbi:MAG: Na+/H+ antiporter NhaC [Pyrinomonadaceae bacterium]|nr:Na+/H+ antiporter NhaC [Pyrinomonadaceae bacterium]